MAVDRIHEAESGGQQGQAILLALMPTSYCLPHLVGFQPFWPAFLLAVTGKKRKTCQKESGAYSTKYSQAVTHPSTNLAQCCLTAVIGRELVCSTWYGRRHLNKVTFQVQQKPKSRLPSME